MTTPPNANPWDTPEERRHALNMAREMMCSDIVPALSSRAVVAACLRNVVGSACLSCQVDKNVVLRRFAASYKPKFTSLVLRRTEPYNTVLLFNKGWIVVIGTNSTNGTLLATHQQRMSLVQLGLRPTLRYFSIDNLVVSGSVPYAVEISEYEDEACDVVYLPYLFPAMIFRFVNPNGTGLLFRGGSFMLVGMSRQEDIDTMYTHLVRVLDLHSLDMGARSASGGGANAAGEMSAAHSSQAHRSMMRARGGSSKKRRAPMSDDHEDDNDDDASDNGSYGDQDDEAAGNDEDDELALIDGDVAGRGRGRRRGRKGGDEFELLPVQRRELMRRVNERLNNSNKRGPNVVREICESEFAIMKEQILVENAKKKSGGGGKKGAASA